MKRLILLFTLFLTITSLFSCADDSEHTHDYSSGWKTTETHHWKKCSVDDCDSVVATSEHNFLEGTDIGNGNAKYICSVCFYEKITHEHKNSSEYTNDENYHWNECIYEGCNNYGTKTEHSYGQGTLKNDGLIHSLCTVCSYEKTETHVHSFAQSFTRTENEHYYLCTFEGCSAKGSLAEHSYGAPSFDGEKEVYTCTDCGYEDKRTHTHSYTGAVLSNENGHFHSCSLPECLSTGELLSHEWSAPSLVEGLEVYVCTVCTYSKSETHTHVPSSDWQRDDNEHWKKCAVLGCNHTESRQPHNWVSRGLIKHPTPDECGEEKFICENCTIEKIEEVDYIPPKMSESEWASYFTFDNLMLEYTCSFDTEEIVYIWLIDGENILITGDEGSYYGTQDDIESFAFLRDYYDSFDIIGEGQYAAQDLTYYDTMLDDSVNYKSVSVSFSESKILKIEFTLDLGILGEITDSYEFIEWGGIEVPDNPREIVTSPESISEMLGNSLDNFTMMEKVESDAASYSALYMFDGDTYSCAIDDEEAVIDTMTDAGASFAYDSIGFFYSLNSERFIYDSENSVDGMDVYNYECGITADGIDIDSVKVELYYDEDGVYAIVLSYEMSLFGVSCFEYTFTEFGATDVAEPERTLVHELCGQSVKRVSVSINELSGGKSEYTQYLFDYSDYVYGNSEYGYSYGRLKDSAAVFITAWLGTLVELTPSDFEKISSDDNVEVYETSEPVISNGEAYTKTRVILVYSEIGDVGIIQIIFKGGDNGKSAQYAFDNFGATLVDTQYQEEDKQIPDGYMTKLLKEASLLNYTFLVSENYYVDDEFVSSNNMTYEFDSHRGRYYVTDSPESAEYIQEDYAGMAFATEFLSFFSDIDESKYINMSSKPVGNIIKLYYEYDGAPTVDGVTLNNLCVCITYKDNMLRDVGISYVKEIVIESKVYTVDIFYTFCLFGNTVVVFPEDDAVIKFNYQRFETDNYAFYTYIPQNDTTYQYQGGKYDSDKVYEWFDWEKYGEYYYTENAGLRDFKRYFGALLDSFSEEELEYSVEYDLKNYDCACIYTSSSIKRLYIPIGEDVCVVSASNFNFSFFYLEGDLVEISLSYDGVINGEMGRIESVIYEIGEQSIVMPSERDFSFDPDNTDELCGNSLDNYVLHESVTKDGNVISSFTGQFEKDYAKYNAMNGTAVTENFNGKADGKGKSFASEKIGFLYGLDTENFECVGAYENNVVYKYTKTVTLSSDKITNLTVTLAFSVDDIDKVDSVIIEYIRTLAGVKSTYEVTLSNFGNVSLVRPDQPNENALPEYLYNAMIDPQDIESATLETKKVGQNGGEYGYASYDDSYDIAGEYYVGGEGMETYTTFEEAKAAYEEHFVHFIDLLEAITPSKLIYNESAGKYMLSGRITYNGYKITTANVEVLQDDRVYIHVFIYGNNNTDVITLDLRIIMKNA